MMTRTRKNGHTGHPLGLATTYVNRYHPEKGLLELPKLLSWEFLIITIV